MKRCGQFFLKENEYSFWSFFCSLAKKGLLLKEKNLLSLLRIDAINHILGVFIMPACIISMKDDMQFDNTDLCETSCYYNTI